MINKRQLGALFEKDKQQGINPKQQMQGNSYPTSQPAQMSPTPAFNAGMPHPMNPASHPGVPHMGSISPTQAPKMPAVPHTEQPNLVQNANKFMRVKKLANFKG